MLLDPLMSVGVSLCKNPTQTAVPENRTKEALKHFRTLKWQTNGFKISSKDNNDLDYQLFVVSIRFILIQAGLI